MGAATVLADNQLEVRLAVVDIPETAILTQEMGLAAMKIGADQYLIVTAVPGAAAPVVALVE